MSRINVRDVPISLHALLKKRAKEHRRSLNSEVLAILEEVVGKEATDRKKAIEQVKRLRASGPTISDNPAEAKRKMREGLL